MSQDHVPEGKYLIEYDDAVKQLTREEMFMATVYAMNMLLQGKGYYSSEEFGFQFRQWAQKELKKNTDCWGCQNGLPLKRGISGELRHVDNWDNPSISYDHKERPTKAEVKRMTSPKPVPRKEAQ